MKPLITLSVVVLLLIGCSSTGRLGIVTRSAANPTQPLEALKSGKFHEIGPVEARACRHFVLAVIPWGDSTFSAAVEDALKKVSGDALVNVAVTSSLYGFVPIYNVYSVTCTTVQGTAVRFQ